VTFTIDIQKINKDFNRKVRKEISGFIGKLQIIIISPWKTMITKNLCFLFSEIQLKAQVDLLKGIIEAEKQMNDELTASLKNQLQAKTPKILISRKPKKNARTMIDVDHSILKDVKIQERVKNE
jgi:aromatic ring-opening dioxygenase LigB subunit